ncbi:hydroxypyruvate isomerase family protein [Roseibium suaedae]|uniref:Hydroxypyruvate isomerase n=1 Tax=Roseibium suaedae TaxID=735517 RepID=A0A1M6YT46_9HYPH|nr:TIM barrel protein [Roseibium suaedae]SHL21446.1 hydroxypyruvate isomerase [Roseibium suaedae]
MSTAYRFSANTGFLWKDRPFLDRILAAKAAGFDAVEFHDEGQLSDRAALKDVLVRTGLSVRGLNVRMAETSGCAAIPGMEDQARQDILSAIDLAEDIGAKAIHVLSGKTQDPAARDTLLTALEFASSQTDKTLLLEPLCHARAPGYFLRHISQAASLIADAGRPNVKIMFDCFHIQAETGDVAGSYRTYKNLVGHIQIASYPDRSEPEGGELDYHTLLPGFLAEGYEGYFGCEYTPAAGTDAGLGWRDRLA